MLLEVQCEVSIFSDDWGAMSSVGVGALCFLKSTVNALTTNACLCHDRNPKCLQCILQIKELALLACILSEDTV